MQKLFNDILRTLFSEKSVMIDCQIKDKHDAGYKKVYRGMVKFVDGILGIKFGSNERNVHVIFRIHYQGNLGDYWFLPEDIIPSLKAAKFSYDLSGKEFLEPNWLEMASSNNKKRLLKKLIDKFYKDQNFFTARKLFEFLKFEYSIWFSNRLGFDGKDFRINKIYDIEFGTHYKSKESLQDELGLIRASENEANDKILELKDRIDKLQSKKRNLIEKSPYKDEFK